MKILSRSVIAVVLGLVGGWSWQTWRFSHSGNASSEVLNERQSRLSLARHTKTTVPPAAWLVTVTNQDTDAVSKLRALFGNHDRGDLKAGLQAIESMENHADRQIALTQLLASWVEIDPSSAFKTCASLSDRRTRNESLIVLVNLWAAVDHEAALPMLETQAAEPVYENLQAAFIKGLSEMLPAQAIDFIFTWKLEDHGRTFLGEVFSNYAGSDPLSAAQDALRLDSDAAINAVIESWSDHDPQAALTFVTAHQDQWTTSLRDPYEHIAKGIFSEDAEAGMNWVLGLIDAELGRGVRDAAIDAIMKSFVKDDPERALAFYKEAHGSGASNRRFMSAFARHDWEAAYTLTMSLEGGEQDTALEGLFDSLGDQPRVVIEKHAITLLDMMMSAGKQGSGYGLFRNLDHAFVADLLNNYPEQFDYSALEGWADRFRREDPANAIGVIESLTDTSMRERVIDRVMMQWAKRDPQEAAQWIERQPEGKLRDHGFQFLADAWGRQAPQAARQWIEALPPSPSRDLAARELVKLQALRDPSGSLALSQHIEDEGMQSAATRDALEGWLWSDPEAAQEAMADFRLTEKDRNRLQQKTEEFAAWKRLAGGE